jgi:soluble lytic murein transglycosylase
MKKRRARRRRRTALAVVAVGVGAVVVVVGLAMAGVFDKALQELTLPLRHEDIIRQQAQEKDVDAALIAAVIYSESKFVDQTSSAGARGLMQLTPEAALEVKRLSEGSEFTLKDLADPEINIRYGTFLLRELLERFDGDEAAALAAYNAGPSNAEEWGGSDLSVEEIPFPETRSYVEEVLAKRDEYRREYGRELGY